MIKHVKDNINKKRENRNQNREAEQRKKIVYKDTIIETPIFRRVSSDEYSEKSGGFLSSIIFLIVAVLCINAGIKNPQLAQILNTFNQKEEDSNTEENKKIDEWLNVLEAEEGKTDGRKYANGMDVAWCLYLLVWGKNQVGIPSDVIPDYGYCGDLINFYNDPKIGRWYPRGEREPEKGCIVVFDWSGNSEPYDHAGVVKEVVKKGDKTEIVIIDGNPKVCTSMRYDITDPRIVGYAFPDFSRCIALNKKKDTLILDFKKKDYIYVSNEEDEMVI